MEHINIVYLQEDSDVIFCLNQCAFFVNPLKANASDMLANMARLSNAKYDQIIKKRWKG